MKNNFRIVIPTQADEFFILFDNVLTKHEQDGINSELNIINMADATAKLAVARNAHNLAEQLSRDAETATQDRNKALGIAQEQKSYCRVLFSITLLLFATTCWGICVPKNLSWGNGVLR